MFSDLVGKTINSIVIPEDKSELRIFTGDRKRYIMSHNQDCCESVYIEDICGDIKDLLESPIIQAEESSNRDKLLGTTKIEEQEDKYASFTWTFYRISTIKGTVVIRWFGESNGYYSEDVDFEEVKDN